MDPSCGHSEVIRQDHRQSKRNSVTAKTRNPQNPPTTCAPLLLIRAPRILPTKVSRLTKNAPPVSPTSAFPSRTSMLPLPSLRRPSSNSTTLEKSRLPSYPALFLTTDGSTMITLWQTTDEGAIPFDRRRNVGLPPPFGNQGSIDGSSSSCIQYDTVRVEGRGCRKRVHHAPHLAIKVPSMEALQAAYSTTRCVWKVEGVASEFTPS
jgi:hypothetical protein